MRQGTVSRLGQYVRGDCEHEGCPEKDAILYLIEEEDALVCADHKRRWIVEHPFEGELCDNDPAHGRGWRDPKTRQNVYLCAKCHGQSGRVFTNRWANAEPRETFVLGLRDKVECAAKDRGTECKGEVRWRSAHRMSLCNKHAGKQGVGPNG